MNDKLKSGDCARYLKALADPERLKIIQCLQSGPKSVGEIAQQLKKELVNVSHHLGVLRHAKIVVDQKQGKYVIYSLHPDVCGPNEQCSSTENCLDLGCCRLEWDKK
jgi:ArsR family transcriptional regulator